MESQGQEHPGSHPADHRLSASRGTVACPCMDAQGAKSEMDSSVGSGQGTYVCMWGWSLDGLPGPLQVEFTLAWILRTHSV